MAKPDLAVLSLTSNSTNFVKKLDHSQLNEIVTIEQRDSEIEMKNDYFLVFSSYEMLEAVYYPIVKFLKYKDNMSKCIGIFGSGNRNIGPEFLITPKRISREYNLNLIMGFEAGGLTHDIEKANEYIKNYNEGKL